MFFLEPVDTNDKPIINQYSSISDLLLWAIFANRKELAEICWLRGTDHLSKSFQMSTVFEIKV